jgi:hypothetical protein
MPSRSRAQRTRTTPDRWLYDLSAMLRPWFKQAGLPITDQIQFRCGHIASRMHLGMTLYPTSLHPITTVVISMYDDDAVIIADTLCHELLHVALGPTGHGSKAWKAGCAAIGLDPHGAPPSYRAAGFLDAAGRVPQSQSRRAKALHRHCQELLDVIGPYPHEAVQRPYRDPGGGGGITNVKLKCPDKHCGFRMQIRVGARSFEIGLPQCECACGDILEYVAEP